MTNVRSVLANLADAVESGEATFISEAMAAANEVLGRPVVNDICSLGMPKELLFPLLRADITKISQLEALGYEGLLWLKQIGPDRAKRIREYL